MNLEKPLSCSLNNCEMFSCILGMEDDTALSIIDPITLNMDVNKEKTLEVYISLLVPLFLLVNKLFVGTIASFNHQIIILRHAYVFTNVKFTTQTNVVWKS